MGRHEGDGADPVREGSPRAVVPPGSGSGAAGGKTRGVDGLDT